MREFCYNNVSMFQKTYGFKRFKKRNNISKTKIFRWSLFSEEFKELLKAIKENDKIEIADGYADCYYVLLGTLWTFKNEPKTFKEIELKLNELEEEILSIYSEEQFIEIFNEVHRSNMSKSCSTIDEVYATMAQEKYKNIKYTFNIVNGKYNIIVDEDFPQMDLMKGKLLKSINYSKPNLEPYI